MRAVLEFNLPEDKEEFEMVSKATNMHLALWDISQYLRTKVKYSDGSDEKADEIYESVREEFYRILGERNIEV